MSRVERRGKLKIKEYRTKAGYKQSEIADVLRCTTGNYSKYERNELEISISSLVKLADFYGISLDELVDRDEFEKKSR